MSSQATEIAVESAPVLQKQQQQPAAADKADVVEIQIKQESTPAKTKVGKEAPKPKLVPDIKLSARKPVKKVTRSNTTMSFDLKYFRGNALSRRAMETNWSDQFDLRSNSEFCQQEAKNNRIKNREQHMNLFRDEPQECKVKAYQQKRVGYNVITGEVYNDRPVMAINEKAALLSSRIHSAR